MPRMPRRRLALSLVALAGIAWLAAVAWLLLDAGSAMRDGRSGLSGTRAGATPSSLLDPSTTQGLARAEAEFDRARSRLRNPLLTPLRLLPVVGRHVRAADRVVGTSRGATDLARSAVDDLRELADRPNRTGPDRVEALDDLAAIVARTRVGLDRLDPGSPDALIGPLADPVAELRSEREDALAGLARAEAVTRAASRVIEGPTPYLLVGANNAEMRAGSGMFLSAANLGFDQGRLVLGDVRPTARLVLPAGSVPVTGDLAENWPWLDPGRDFRNFGLTADFPQSARLARANWAKVPGGTEVGGVIAVDVEALRALLGVVGPVEVGGVTYTVDTVRGELLRQQYTRFEGDSEERRDQLGEVAREVFARLESGDWKLDQLATALIGMVESRHLIVWSADAPTQRAWVAAGAAGHLRPDSLSAVVLNRGSQKLDSFIDTAVTVRSRRRGDGRVALSLTYRLTNGAPDTGPAYLIGPNLPGLVAGEHRGIVVVNLPAGVTDVKLSGARQTLLGSDGPAAVVAGEVQFRRGETLEVKVTGVLARGDDTVVIEPAARIPGTRWTVDGRTFDADRRRTVQLGG